MADKPILPRKDDRQVLFEGGAVPRMGMSVPMPAGTKPPPPPGPQSSSKPAS
jgi:hypothetical protein